MAEMITVNHFGDELNFFNVSSSVGRTGVNNTDDVYLVQAMLRELPDRKRGDITLNECPIPTGTLDYRTQNLIKKYQYFFVNRDDRVVSDGMISHAKGLQPNGSRRHWTIIRLNFDLLEVATLNANISVFDYLMNKYPRLSLMIMA